MTMFETTDMQFETRLIHSKLTEDELTGAVNVPIYQTSTYRQQSLGENQGYEYSRTANPTRAALEALIADLEQGPAGFAFASGMAAITAVLSLFSAGDKLLLGGNVYGGTFRVLAQVFSRFNINYAFADMSDGASLQAAITPEVKAIILESPTNPLLSVTDLAAVAKTAHQNGVLVIVDNTFMTPYLQQPLLLGADIVIHSATKYLGGHSDLIAGLVVVNSTELAERLAFIQNATGGILQPFDSFLLLRGIKTLAVRMDRHVANAEAVVRYLAEHPAVKRLYYPGLPSDRNYEVNRRQAKNGGAMLAFELQQNYDIRLFFRSLRTIALAESLGGVETLACHPASMTHASIPADLRQQLGISDNLVRLSVGIENERDIIADLVQAITASKRSVD